MCLGYNGVIPWFQINQLALNTKKTKFMNFGNNHVLNNFNDIKLNYDNATI